MITGNEETKARWQTWCEKNNLTLNISKTKEMVIDPRRVKGYHKSLLIGGSEVTTSSWVSILVRTMKTQQRLYFLRSLRKFGMLLVILKSYKSTVECILTCCIACGL